MLLTIHDANLRKVAFVDNEKQGTLNYYNDIWTRDLETGSSSFEFTVFKKSLVSDTILHKTYSTLNEKAFVSFYYHGKTYLFNVMKVEETEQTITCYCENLNLELINEYVNPYKAKKAMSFVEYCNAMDLLNMTHLTVGINEISDQKRTLEWEGQDTKLARLLSLAHKFDAEIDFETHLHYDSSIKAFIVNVYHEYDDNHNGVGRIRDDIQLTYGKNLKSIKRTIDKTGIYNMIRPTGKKMVKNGKGEEVEQVVTIKSLGVWSEDNADGMREFYQSGEALFAPLSAQLYPSTFTHGTQRDQWTRKDMEVDSDNPTVIRAAAIKELKKIAYPSITYEVDGFLDVEVGDTIRIYDYGFFPVLLVKARVSKQKISFTNRSKNKTVFANFRALKVNRSSTIQAALERLIETTKPYTIKFATDNGVIFKNRTGESLVTPSLYKGTKSIVNDVTWRWTLNNEVTTGMTYLMTASNVMTTDTLKVAAYIGNDEVAVDEVTFVNVNDGEKGDAGKTSYVHFAYADVVKHYYNDTKPDYLSSLVGYQEAQLNTIQGKNGVTVASSGGTNVIKTVYNFSETTGKSGWLWLNITNTHQKNALTIFFNGIGPETNARFDAITLQAGETASFLREAYARDTYDFCQVRFEATDVSHDLSFTINELSFLTEYPYQKFSLESKGQDYLGKYTDFEVTASNDPKRYDWSLVKGEISQEQLDDINTKLDAKAGQEFTIQQLVELEERTALARETAIAEAMQHTLSDVEVLYKTWFETTTKDDRQKVADDIASLMTRMSQFSEDLGEASAKFSFIRNQTLIGEEGVAIGDKEANMQLFLSKDSISFISNGTPQMTLTGSTLYIKNGLFTERMQVGQYVEEVYDGNPEYNVGKYIGGISVN